jgi:hypothetical protein
VRSPWWLWIRAARVRQRLAWRRSESAEALIRRHAPGRSFADIGAMWSVHGQMAFLAEDSGATAVTAVDVMAPTPAYEQEHARRDSNVRFLRGDIHDPAVAEAIGRHDVVWCSGVVYHAPHPLATLERLHAITGDVLILATETIPEVPGLAQACVFLPGLSGRGRALHAAARPGVQSVGITTPFDPVEGYSAWWWGISPGALRAMLDATGFTVEWEQGGPLHRTVVARPREAPPMPPVPPTPPAPPTL